MGDETSQRIKRAALTRFVEVGFGSTTVDELAANAGVGVASLYRRWPDKSALANELIVDYLNKFDTILAPVEGGTRKSRFQTLWSRLWSQAEQDPDLFLFFEAQAHAGFMSAEVASLKSSTVNRWIERCGEFGIEADPVVAAAMLIGTITAVWRNRSPVDPDDLCERLWAALRAA